ncbi:4Fe-4S cluster-binding domain-containing protein, partial [Enterobacter hormaechei]
KFNTLFDCLKNNEKLGFVGRIILLCDIVVDQPFIEEEKDLTLKWRGSKNQRVISVQQSLAQKKVVLYDER